MKCRTMNIRLAQPFAAIDEEAVNGFLGSVRIRRLVASLCGADEASWSVLVFYEETDSAPEATPPETEASSEAEAIAPAVEDDSPAMLPDDLRLVDDLKSWRSARAASEGLPPYCVAQNRSLDEIARTRPRSSEALAQIKGLGPARIEKYGPDILSLVTSSVESA